MNYRFGYRLKALMGLLFIYGSIYGVLYFLANSENAISKNTLDKKMEQILLSKFEILNEDFNTNGSRWVYNGIREDWSFDSSFVKSGYANIIKEQNSKQFKIDVKRNLPILVKEFEKSGLKSDYVTVENFLLKHFKSLQKKKDYAFHRGIK